MLLSYKISHLFLLLFAAAPTVDQSCQTHDQTTGDTTDPSRRTTRQNMMALAADPHHKILIKDILRWGTDSS